MINPLILGEFAKITSFDIEMSEDDSHYVMFITNKTEVVFTIMLDGKEMLPILESLNINNMH